MITATATKDDVMSAIATLRSFGREAEARAVEALLAASGPRAETADDSDGERVSIAEAAERLGDNLAQIRRRIEFGMLTGAKVEGPGDAGNSEFVTRASLDKLLDIRRSLAIIADFPDRDDEDSVPNTSTLLAQMIAYARQRDERS